MADEFTRPMWELKRRTGRPKGMTKKAKLEGTINELKTRGRPSGPSGKTDEEKYIKEHGAEVGVLIRECKEICDRLREAREPDTLPVSLRSYPVNVRWMRYVYDQATLDGKLLKYVDFSDLTPWGKSPARAPLSEENEQRRSAAIKAGVAKFWERKRKEKKDERQDSTEAAEDLSGRRATAQEVQVEARQDGNGRDSGQGDGAAGQGRQGSGPAKGEQAPHTGGPQPAQGELQGGQEDLAEG